MLGFALNSKKLKDKLMDTSHLISEVTAEYARTMNRLAFDHAHLRGHSGCAAMLIPIEEEFSAEARRSAPERATAEVRRSG
jgi:dynein heavy chain, axonemal